ncbi:MAG: hypothetical protein WDN02_16680 [Methylovirgula sp.]|uniref:hypothetical protein n=1 Tax=Methylovirgula sp. TaxID=1978224 RepID=UPI0030760D4C
MTGELADFDPLGFSGHVLSETAGVQYGVFELHKDLMSKTRVRFRCFGFGLHVRDASIDGVEAEYEAQVRQFLQPLILVESLCPGRGAFRRTGVAPCDSRLTQPSGCESRETERVLWTELRRKPLSPL